MRSSDSPVSAPSQLELVVENSPDFIGITDLSGKMIYGNTTALELLGSNRVRILQTKMAECFCPEQAMLVNESVLPAVLRKGCWMGELTLQNQETSLQTPVLCSVFRLDDPQTGAPLNFAMTARLRTGQKDDILETETSPEVGTWTYSIAENRFLADEKMVAFCRMHSGAESESVEIFSNAIHPEDRDEVMADLAKVIEKETDHLAQFRILGPDGSIRWVLARASIERNEAGKAVQMPGVILDRTDKMLALHEQAALSREVARQHRLAEGLLSSISDEAFLFDRQARFIFANRALLDLWGMTLPEIVGKSFLELKYTPEQALAVEGQIAEVIRTKASVTGKIDYTSPTGVAGYYEHILSPIFGDDGSVEMVAGTSRNITVEHKAMEMMRTSEEHFRTLAETLPTSTWTTDKDGRPLWTNSLMQRMSGLSLAEICEKGFGALVHPDDGPTQQAAWAKARETSGPVEFQYRMRQPGDEWRWHLVRGAPIKDENGKVLSWIGTSTDIHDQREMQESLERSEEMFRQLANTIPQLAWMANPDGSLFWYNQRWYEYTGTTAEEMIGWGWQSVHDSEALPGVLRKYTASIASKQPFDMIFPLRGADGIFRPFLTRTMPLIDRTGEIVLWFGTNTDISEQRKLLQERDELLASERVARSQAEHASRMKDEFLATLSHELRTPLNAIFGWTQLMKSGAGDDEETVTEAIEVIDRNVRVQTQLVDDLLDMSRIISGKLRLNLTKIDIAAALESAIETVLPAARARNISIGKTIDFPSGLISGDEARFQQIFWNLLSNAIKFTPSAGRVEIRLKQAASYVEIEIADDGQGISEEFLPHVFDRFRQADAATTRKHGGLGLGLAIVKQLVELHGGHISVKSAGLNRGATFSLHLPILSLQPTVDSAVEIENPGREIFPLANIAGLKILVVDDEKDARELLRRILIDRSATVTVAESASQALELIRITAPDVLISDIGMSEIDGYEFLRRVRSLEPQFGGRTPAIALTAFARSEDRTRALLAGFISHISKPVEVTELIATIAAIAGRNL